MDDFPVNSYQRLKQKLGLISPASGLQPQGLFVRLFTFKLLAGIKSTQHPHGLAAQEGHSATRVRMTSCWEPLPELLFRFSPHLKN